MDKNYVKKIVKEGYSKIANEKKCCGCSDSKKIFNYPNSNHVLLADYDKDQVIKDMFLFEINNDGK